MSLPASEHACSSDRGEHPLQQKQEIATLTGVLQRREGPTAGAGRAFRVGLTTLTARAAIILLEQGNRRGTAAGAGKQERDTAKPAGEQPDRIRNNFSSCWDVCNGSIFKLGLTHAPECATGAHDGKSAPCNMQSFFVVLCRADQRLLPAAGREQLAGRLASAAAAAEGHKQIGSHKSLEQPSGAGLRNQQHALPGRPWPFQPAPLQMSSQVGHMLGVLQQQ